MWLKYSSEPILEGEYGDRAQETRFEGRRSRFDKPCGCWITDDSEDCWREWCVSEGFRLEDLTHKHEVLLDESNLLILRSPDAIDEFTLEFGCEDYIAWEKVADRYDGLIITPYQRERRWAHDWYHTWDCASGCIWKARAIRGIRLIEVDHAVAEKREEAA